MGILFLSVTYLFKMNHKNKKYIIFIALSMIMFWSIFFSYGCKKKIHIDSPKAIEGVIDLQNWDFVANGTVNLDGHWEFYNQKLLSNIDFEQNHSIAKTGFILVPKKWDDTTIQGETLKGMGYGTYRLKLLLKNKIDLALKIKTIGTAYNLYINENLISKEGKVGDSPDTSIPDWNPSVIDLGKVDGEISIIVQVSNFSVKSGGLWDSIQLGEKSQITLLREIGISRDTFLAGSLFIMGLYHISIYYFRRTDKSTILFGTFCFIMSLRSILTGEIVLKKIFSGLPWIFYANLEYFTFFFAIPTSVVYYESCFPDDFNKRIYKYFLIISALICLVVVVSPIQFYTSLLRPMQILTMLISIYTISVVIITVKKKREGAFVFLLGYIIFMITIFNDFLHNIKIINTGYYSVLGLFFFIFSQAYILSKKSSLALTRVEELTESLEKKVLQRTEELSKERDRLIGANLQIEKLSESRKRLSIIGQMASGIVHDIKNPMSTIKSFAELVRGGNLSNIEKEEYLSYISREIDRLSDMTYEILDFSKGNIQLFIQNESISKILNEVYEFLKIDFDHSQISLQLEIQEDFILDFDRDRIRRVIFNLANNAKEEMSDGVKEYSFKIKAYTEDSFGIISFTDNGYGIREDVKQKIFEAYSSEGKEYGIGLGLFMCKQIIDAHNGYITFDSRQGQGTVFYIKLPLSENK